MITPSKPSRITGYASGSPAWRVTLQREDREGRTVSYLPEIATTQGSAPDYATSHLFRGFRPRLEISWAVGTGSTLELWEDGAWIDGGEILTASALLGLLSACDDGDLRVEPWRTSAGVGAFWARCWADPQEIRDTKGILHSGLKITLEGAGGESRSGTVDGDAQHSAAGLLDQIPDPRAASNPLYIRTSTPAAAWDRNAVYLYKQGGIYLWNPDSDTETLWASLPTAAVGTLDHLDVSTGYLFAHYDHITQQDAMIHARAVYKRPLDGSADWSLVADFGWQDWAGINGWWTNKINQSVAFAGGAVYLTTMGDTPVNPAGMRSWRSQIVPGESTISYSALRADQPLYYASADRTLLGGMSVNAASLATSDDQRGGNTFDATVAGGYVLDFGGYHWVYASDSAGIHARRATLTGNAGVGYTWSYDDHVYPGAALSSVPPVPFAARSLLILSDGSGLWWDGATFTPEPLGRSGGSLVPVRYGTASANSTSGHAVSLRDGSVLHVG